MFNFPTSKELSAVEALSQAQYIAFSPFIFQATCALQDLKILSHIDEAGNNGIDIEALAQACQLPKYGVNVLLDFALSIGIVHKQDSHYHLTKVGYFLQNDKMTQVNFNFSQHFCYQGLGQLTQAIKTGKPEGLKIFGDWQTVYPALTSLPKETSESWFEFDHYYSDQAFDEALDIVFSYQPKCILDIGGNTGKWSLKCLAYSPDVKMVIMDLPQQLEVASINIEQAGFGERFTAYPCDMLDPKQNLYHGADIIWMSQFLDCFSPEEIIAILKKAVTSMEPDHKLCIMETFIDKQKYDAASFSLNATSLYFTCFANGNSRMYRSTEFLPLIEQAGLKIVKMHDFVGVGHSLIVCERQ